MAKSPRIRARYVVLVALVVLGLVFRQQIAMNVKVGSLLAQEFPQVPVKPLDLFTNAPEHRVLMLASPNGPIVADLFLPRPHFGTIGLHSMPAIVFCVGVQLTPTAKTQLRTLGANFARIGYVVMWPRLRPLDRGREQPEEPETFVRAFAYLQELQPVDPHRISFLGFSVGASMAIVAASTQPIAGKVRSLVSFGGYYDIFDYLASLATRRERYRGREIPWAPRADAVKEAHAILRTEHATPLLAIFKAGSWTRARSILAEADPEASRALERFSPSYHLAGFRTRIYILHDHNDHYVPYVESEKLYSALDGRVPRSILLTDLVQHTVPNGGNFLGQLGKFWELYVFAYGALNSF